MSGSAKVQSAEIVLNYKDVCFAYDRNEVLHNINLQIHRCDMVAIVGPNGGGKSTLLKLALGIVRPLRGRVELFKQPLCKQLIKRTGYVPQSMAYDAAFPVNVLDVVLMGRAERHLWGRYDQADRSAAYAALEDVELLHLARRPFSQLSGGEKQRVMIAQALSTQPEILFLDEPTANVDTAIEDKIFSLLARLKSTVTIVLVSHNLNVVTRYASQVVCVNHVLTQMELPELTEDSQHTRNYKNMLVLQHDPSCPVIDPADMLHTPHREALRGKQRD